MSLDKLFNPAQRQRLASAIPKRYSCRRYAAPPSTADWAALNYAAQRYALPGVRLFLHQVQEDIFTGMVLSYGRITGCTTIAVVAADLTNPLAKLHAGAAGEALCLEAAALGLGTCWVAGTYKRGKLDLPLKEGETLLSIIALGVPADTKPSRRRKPLERLCQQDPAAWPDAIRQAALAVQAAPSAINLQPWRMAYEPGLFTLTAPGLQQVDLGIALCHAALTLPPHTWTLSPKKCTAAIK